MPDGIRVHRWIAVALIALSLAACGRAPSPPDAATAATYVASGRYFWNGGMFVFRAATFLAELERLQPAVLAACKGALDGARRDLDFLRLEEKSFAASPSISIDYAVMERIAAQAGAGSALPPGVVLPLSAGWSDVGAWDALPDVAETDEAGNVTMGDVVAIDCTDSILMGHDKRVLAAVGLRNIVVVDTEDALLVAPRDRVQEVRAIVESLRHREGKII